jgi:hypothetical protein
LHLVGRLADTRHRGLGRIAVSQVPDDVLHHHDGPVDHHAKVERTKRQQVGRDLPQVQADGREQERKRNGQGDDQRAARVAQEDEQDDHHQHDAFGQVLQHRVRRVMHEVAAIEERHNLDAGRQDVIVELLDLRLDGLQRGVRLGALPQQHDAFDHIAVVHESAVGPMNRLANLTQPDLGPLRDRGHIADAERRAILGLDHRLLDVPDAGHHAERPHIDLLQPLLDEAAAGIHVVAGELLLELPDVQAIGHQLVGINPHLVLAGGPSEAADIDHVGHRLELLLEHPVLEGLQFHQVVGRIAALQRVPEDLPDRAPVGPHLRHQVLGKGDLREALEDLLPVPVILGGIIEDQHHAGQAEQ